MRRVRRGGYGLEGTAWRLAGETGHAIQKAHVVYALNNALSSAALSSIRLSKHDFTVGSARNTGALGLKTVRLGAGAGDPS